MCNVCNDDYQQNVIFTFSNEKKSWQCLAANRIMENVESVLAAGLAF